MLALRREAVFWLALLLALTACTGEQSERALADRRAAELDGMRRHEIQTSVFRLVSYARFNPAEPMLRVYIEGDGHAWLRQDEPSDDPTPWSPISLELALCDPTRSVAYLARPCQFIAHGSDPRCKVDYWTQRRYAEPVIASTDQAIDWLKAASGARSIELVGFSGGGAVATLVAARRHDVVNLRTVAANLDTDLWTAEHGISPLTGSLNPADFADRLVALPQLHFVGDEDTVVPPMISRSYLARFADRACVTVAVIPGVDHLNGWREIWPGLLQRPVICRPR